MSESDPTTPADRAAAPAPSPSAPLRARTSAAPPPPPPPTPPAARSTPATERDLGDLADTLRRLGLLAELEPDAVPPAGAPRSPSVWLDVLERYYYDASGDSASAAERRTSDRVVIFHANTFENAQEVIDELLRLSPEIERATLVRVGGPDGPIALRAKGRVFAVVDERQHEPGADADTVALKSLVVAFNMVLARAAVPRRFVDLPSDGRREAYVVLARDPATYLCQARFLEELRVEAMHAMAGW